MDCPRWFKEAEFNEGDSWKAEYVSNCCYANNNFRTSTSDPISSTWVYK